MQIIFCRHGETIYNQEDRFQGHSDSLLTQKGIEEAQKLAVFFETYDDPFFLLSPLKRVQSTFALINTKNYSYELRDNLIEVCYGDWEEQKKTELRNLPIWKVREQNRFNFVHPGSYNGVRGESYRIVYERLVPWFTDIKKTQKNPLVIIAHLGIMLAAYTYFKKMSDVEASKLKFSHEQILVVNNAGVTIQSI